MRRLCLLLLAACTPPPDAPEDLGDLGLYLFQHHATGDDALYATALEALRPFILDADLDASPHDRAVTMPALTGDWLGDRAIPDGAEVDKQSRVGIPGLSPHPVDDHRPLFVDPNQVCISSDSTIWAERTFELDPSCFESGHCNTLQTHTETYKDSTFIDVWLDLSMDYRALTLSDDTTAIVGRLWMDERAIADNPNKSWDQHFAIEVFLEDPNDSGQTLRWNSIWSSITLPGLPSSLLGSSLIGGSEQRAVYAEEYLHNRIETCPNDRDLPRPPRG